MKNVLLAVLGLLAASCGGDDAGGDSCEGVADEFIVLVECTVCKNNDAIIGA